LRCRGARGIFNGFELRDKLFVLGPQSFERGDGLGLGARPRRKLATEALVLLAQLRCLKLGRFMSRREEKERHAS